MSEVRQNILSTFCRRPTAGNLGRQVRVRSNFFEVLALPTQNIVHYDVTITPDVPPALNRKIFQEFEIIHREGKLNGIRSVFDGRKNIFAPQNFPFGDAATFDRTPKIFKFKIKKTGEIYMEELHRFLQGRNSMTPNCLTAIMALDVLIRHLPSMQHVTVGRSFFTKTGSQPLFGGAEVWQGYYQSARPAYEKMLINVDLSATAFYESGPLVQIITKILCRRTPDDLRRGFTDKELIRVEKTLKNVKIRVIHRGEATSK
ncbi:12082_t:CDS:2, partial [Funneliformis geosporum]